MSTEHQRFSTANQAAAIGAYATAHGYEVVRTYADEGISGLRLKGRAGLSALLADVVGRQGDFDVVLVYDVSRWGRFQDPDQSAHYEFLCRGAGVAVEYCAETFDNDGSLGSTLAKQLKRAMAAEFSRELAVKVSAGQRRLARLGYWTGGPPGYGFRRVIVDEQGVEVTRLDRGQYKAIQAYRTVLVVGPSDEVAVVQGIYARFVEDGLSRRAIARELNAEAIASATGNPWTGETVHEILTNPKYIGVYEAHKSVKPLGRNFAWVPEAERVRIEGFWPAMVPKRAFAAAQRIIAHRIVKMSDTDMLSALTGLLREKGALSATIIDRAPGVPCAEIYRRRFGGLRGAYQRIGYAPPTRRGRWALGHYVARPPRSERPEAGEAPDPVGDDA